MRSQFLLFNHILVVYGPLPSYRGKQMSSP